MSLSRFTWPSTGPVALIDNEVRDILQEGRAIALILLKQHYDQLTKLAEALIEREQVDKAEFEAILANRA